MEKRDELFAKLNQLPILARNAVPRTWLLLHLLKAEELRSADPAADNFKGALDNINAAATAEATRDFYNKDPEWETMLKPEVSRILETLKSHKDLVRRLEEPLRTSAEIWKMDLPYMMLADTDTTTQKKVDFYKAALRMTGNLTAKTKVGGYLLKLSEAKRASGDEAGARPLLTESLRLIREAAAGGELEGMFLRAEVLRNGIGEPRNLDVAIGLYSKLKEQNYPEAAYGLGQSFLAKVEDSNDPAMLAKAEEWLKEATLAPDSLNVPEAYYWLARVYDLKKDPLRMALALEAGAKAGESRCQYTLGRYQIAGQNVAANITLGRDNVTKAARSGHAEALKYLRESAAKWQKSAIPGDREWVSQNADILSE